MKKRSFTAAAASLLILSATSGLVASQAAWAQTSAPGVSSAATPGASVAGQAPAVTQTTQATAAADQPVPPPLPATSIEVTNPYGLGALWANGDFVARFVLILLVLMSMGSWYIMISKFLEQRVSAVAEKSPTSSCGVRRRCAQGAEQLEVEFAVPLYRADRDRRERASRRSVAREGGSQYVDHVSIERAHYQRVEPFAGRPRISRHGRLDGAVRRPVRHGMGHLSRADRNRYRRTGIHRQGRGAGR